MIFKDCWLNFRKVRTNTTWWCFVGDDPCGNLSGSCFLLRIIQWLFREPVLEQNTHTFQPQHPRFWWSESQCKYHRNIHMLNDLFTYLQCNVHVLTIQKSHKKKKHVVQMLLLQLKFLVTSTSHPSKISPFEHAVTRLMARYSYFRSCQHKVKENDHPTS